MFSVGVFSVGVTSSHADTKRDIVLQLHLLFVAKIAGEILGMPAQRLAAFRAVNVCEPNLVGFFLPG